MEIETAKEKIIEALNDHSLSFEELKPVAEDMLTLRQCVNMLLDESESSQIKMESSLLQSSAG